ncbi:zinc finger BED domain-containing protein 1-like [Monomorium pharaonis]|uniref:zinc finger BED domain-containing protein 1-like n=1 Tax=Monomorium pharaonis TaxID=307658 RepID=UPI001747D2ED|nr:zinc finger BED domain-containing protein 1-like [Monomorium pharaonis]
MKNAKEKSDVWKHFKKESSTSARCILCMKVLKHGGNTTNLHNHYKKVHKMHVGTGPTSPKQSKMSSENSLKFTPGINQKETKITDSFSRINSFMEGGSSANKLTNCILFMITTENLPLSLVDSKSFRRLINTAAPMYKIPSRRTITRLIDAKYDILKESFKKHLKLGSTFTLTCDIWTDVSNQSYIGVTIHYLRHELVLSNAMIGVFPLTQNHTANYIKDTMISILESFNIDVTSIAAIVTDSTANMTKAIIDGFGLSKHLPCIAHLLSHLVPDAIKLNPPIDKIITRVKSIVTVTKRSVVASDELKRLQIRDGKTENTALKFKQDVPTRWNSTYHMIKRFLELKNYVYSVLMTCPTASTALTRDEIKILEDIVQVLGPIEFVTNEISGDSYPTSSLVIPLIHCMEATIKNCITKTLEGNAFKDSILFEIQRRFKEIESYQIFAVLTILDPRYKKMHFKSIRAASVAISHINRKLKTISTNNNTESNVIEHVEPRTNSKLNEFNVWNIHQSLVESCASSVDEPGGMNLELRQYLNQPIIPREQDVFKFWQTLRPAYPTLFVMAISYLSIVATSVPSERMFSKAGIIKSDLRSRLSGKRLNSLLFLGSLSEEIWGLD